MKQESNSLPQNKPRVPSYIAPFVEGDSTRTAFSAGTLNELVFALNALLAMRGTSGIRIYKSDAGFVIDGANVSGSTASTGSGGTGTVNFRGRWQTATAYSIDDIVTFAYDGDLNARGTYICLQNHTSAGAADYPPTGSNKSNAYWNTLAVGHYDRALTVGDAVQQGTSFSPYPDANGPYTLIQRQEIYSRGLTGYGYDEVFGTIPNTASMTIGPDAGLAFDGQYNTLTFDTTLNYAGQPLHFSPISLQVCVGGVTKTLWVLGMAPF